MPIYNSVLLQCKIFWNCFPFVNNDQTLMLSSRILIVPFILQVMCMGVDELFFHHQRKLPRWERIGHPLDTLTVLLCFAWILGVPPSDFAISIYIGLSLFSCLFVTKDEWVHHTYCSAGEQWMHALQFIFHTLVLLCAGLLWPAIHRHSSTWVEYVGFERTFFIGNFFLTFGFGLYQLIYWNFIWRPASAHKEVIK